MRPRTERSLCDWEGGAMGDPADFDGQNASVWRNIHLVYAWPYQCSDRSQPPLPRATTALPQIEVDDRLILNAGKCFSKRI